MTDGGSTLREDVGGPIPPDVSGKLEAAVFDGAAAKHSLDEKRLEMGLFGLLGNSASAPNHIAFISMVIGLAIATGCVVASFYSTDPESKFLQSYSERAMGFSAACLSFIFGRSTVKS